MILRAKAAVSPSNAWLLDLSIFSKSFLLKSIASVVIKEADSHAGLSHLVAAAIPGSVTQSKVTTSNKVRTRLPFLIVSSVKPRIEKQTLRSGLSKAD